ncbi:MAG: HAD-IC family P-type ATPase, partial [Nitrososphaerota archaeon]
MQPQAAEHEGVPWHSLTVEESLSRLGSGYNGLATEEARRRLAQYGPNQIERLSRPSPVRIFLKQFANILMGLLIVAVFISGFLGEVVDSVVIGIIVFFVAVIGFVQEYKAEKTLESLKRMLTPTTTVVRDGREAEVMIREIVPGDVVVLSAGSKVPADMRLIEAVNLQVDEAPLTGESVPVAKSTHPQPEKTPLHDRVNIAFAGTTVTYGRGIGLVYATGQRTEFGKIATEATAVVEEKTPLEARMDEIGRRFALLAIVIIAAIILTELVGELLAGSISFTFLVEVLLFAVAVAVAVVPEALPGIVTATLAIGMGIMARRNALVRRMPAVETLGSTQVICFDKTGTLTLNQMTVRKVYLNGRILDVSGLDAGPGVRLLVRAGLLCNDASLADVDGRRTIRGDPTEGALLIFAEELKVVVDDERKANPRVYEVPF